MRRLPSGGGGGPAGRALRGPAPPVGGGVRHVRRPPRGPPPGARRLSSAAPRPGGRRHRGAGERGLGGGRKGRGAAEGGGRRGWPLEPVPVAVAPFVNLFSAFGRMHVYRTLAPGGSDASAGIVALVREQRGANGSVTMTLLSV